MYGYRLDVEAKHTTLGTRVYLASTHEMASPVGLEPTTGGLEGHCSSN